MLALEDGAAAAVDAFHAHMARAGVFDGQADGAGGSQQGAWRANGRCSSEAEEEGVLDRLQPLSWLRGSRGSLQSSASPAAEAAAGGMEAGAAEAAAAATAAGAGAAGEPSAADAASLSGRASVEGSSAASDVGHALPSKSAGGQQQQQQGDKPSWLRRHLHRKGSTASSTGAQQRRSPDMLPGRHSKDSRDSRGSMDDSRAVRGSDATAVVDQGSSHQQHDSHAAGALELEQGHKHRCTIS